MVPAPGPPLPPRGQMPLGSQCSEQRAVSLVLQITFTACWLTLRLLHGQNLTNDLHLYTSACHGHDYYICFHFKAFIRLQYFIKAIFFSRLSCMLSLLNAFVDSQNSHRVKYSSHYRPGPSVKHFQHLTAGTLCVLLSFSSALEIPSSNYSPACSWILHVPAISAFISRELQ